MKDVLINLANSYAVGALYSALALATCSLITYAAFGAVTITPLAMFATYVLTALITYYAIEK
jgi:hypothetical protein